MPNEVSLLPCPFCGGEAKILRAGQSTHGEHVSGEGGGKVHVERIESVQGQVAAAREAEYQQMLKETVAGTPPVTFEQWCESYHLAVNSVSRAAWRDAQVSAVWNTQATIKVLKDALEHARGCGLLSPDKDSLSRIDAALLISSTLLFDSPFGLIIMGCETAGRD